MDKESLYKTKQLALEQALRVAEAEHILLQQQWQQFSAEEAARALLAFTEVEKALEQEKLAHSYTEVQKARAEEFQRYVVQSLSWRCTSPLRNLLQICKKKREMYKKRSLTYVCYQLYLRLPGPFREIIRKVVRRKLKANSPAVVSEALSLFLQSIKQMLAKEETILYVQPTILNFVGVDFYSGGAERYALDLQRILAQRGYHFVCIQYSLNDPWIRHYLGLTIIGLPSPHNEVLFNHCLSIIAEKAKCVISSPFTLVQHPALQNVIGISHGIYWDQKRLNKEATSLATKVNSMARLVSVDTATVNFIRSHNIEYVQKIDYIPNYVDHTQFPIVEKTSKTLTVLYPRRLYGPRGFWVVCKIIPSILATFEHVVFVFCGTGGIRELQKVRKLQHQYKERVKYLVYPPQDMHKAYKEADIVLIPTVHSEGTSLSLIEAMASQKAIIATCVGGLTDLVTDRYTGLLIRPDSAEELADALKELILNQELRQELAKNAYQKSLCFNIKYWEQKWIAALSRVLGPLPKPFVSLKKYSILHPASSGIVFDYMKQRPQQLLLAISSYANVFFIEEKKRAVPYFPNKNFVVAGKDTVVDMSGMILYSYQAYHYDIIKQATMVALVYDVLDDPSIHNSASYNEKHQKMLERADIIITSSELLYQQYKQSFLEKRVSYIPNAVHMPDFSLQPNTPKPKDFPCYASYTIGYFGAIAEWFDYDLLDLVCKRNLDKQIVLIGPCREGFLETELIQALVKSNCNLFYLGVKPHQELALYGKYFDVALIPFIDNDITRHCSPVKLFEYMALGLPIVTTNIPECRKYTSALVAQDREEFLLQIEKAGKIPKESMYFQTMRQEAEANTWDARAQAVMKVVHETLASM